MVGAPLYGGPPEPGAPPPKKKKVGLLILVLVLVAGCIPCTGVLAAISIPAFTQYVRRSKAVEAESNLRMLFAGASAYYEQERLGPDRTMVTRCSVGPAITSNIPSSTKQPLGPLDAAFRELGFSSPEPLFFQYEIVAAPGACSHGPNEAVYTFRAYGDLDDDGVTSLYELAVGTDETGALYRSPELYIERELE